MRNSIEIQPMMLEDAHFGTTSEVGKLDANLGKPQISVWSMRLETRITPN